MDDGRVVADQIGIGDDFLVLDRGLHDLAGLVDFLLRQPHRVAIECGIGK